MEADLDSFGETLDAFRGLGDLIFIDRQGDA
jgi:hypothetical protein